MLSDAVMMWLAVNLGQRIDWNGPVVYGHGYKWCGKIWFPPPQENEGRAAKQPET